MGLIELIILSVGLAMDALAVGITFAFLGKHNTSCCIDRYYYTCNINVWSKDRECIW